MMECPKCLSHNVIKFIDGNKMYCYCLHCLHGWIYEPEYVHACPEGKIND
jgi:hypothetical protein